MAPATTVEKPFLVFIELVIALSPLLGVRRLAGKPADRLVHETSVTAHAVPNPVEKLLTVVNFAEFSRRFRVCPEARFKCCPAGQLKSECAGNHSAVAAEALCRCGSGQAG
jgi:hypothetical protein